MKNFHFQLMGYIFESEATIQAIKFLGKGISYFLSLFFTSILFYIRLDLGIIVVKLSLYYYVLLFNCLLKIRIRIMILGQFFGERIRHKIKCTLTKLTTRSASVPS